MAKAKINESGELVNAETGEVIGNRHGDTIRMSSRDSREVFSLEDYGVKLPDFPEENEEDKSDDDEDFASGANVPLNKNSNTPMNANPQASQPVAKTAGPSSFSRKKTKYEITKDSYLVIKFGLYQGDDGRFIPIQADAVDGIPQSELHWVKFRMWNYGEELQWKSEFLEYNSVSKTQLLNTDKLNERKIKYLMLDWSFGESEDSLKLLHCDGRLSDESYDMFMGLYPSIAKTIVNLMNSVLENNQ